MKTDPWQRLFLTMILLLVLACGWRPAAASETEEAGEAPAPLLSSFRDCFSWDLRVLTYGVAQDPEDSSQNPDNAFLEIPRYTADLEARPDLRFVTDRLELSAKPRVRLEDRIWKEGPRDGDREWEDDGYINEWLARVTARENLFVSFGRENLQWGPSFLVSPSNPFFSDNGRSNPYMEVPGMDFGRLVYIPHGSWSVSLIVNTDEGRNRVLGPDPFEKTWAVKIDYSGGQNYASLIASRKEDDNTLGVFGGWTVSDAVLVYGEGSVRKGDDALYPEEDPASPFGLSMRKTHEDSAAVRPVALAGGSYTLEGSGTVSLEYLYYGPGYDSDEARDYYSLRDTAAAALPAGGTTQQLGVLTLSQTLDPGLRFQRENYLMLQYYQTSIFNRMEITLRWTKNVDDGAAQYLGLFSCSLGNHFELFSSGVYNPGPSRDDSEFGTLLGYQLMLGLKYTL